MRVTDELMQQYEMLRSRVLADKENSVFSAGNVSVEILSTRGLIGWSQVWAGSVRDNEAGSLSSARTTVSGSETRLSCERESEAVSILVNMALGYLNTSKTTEKGATL